MAQSVDPDQMPHFAESALDLHCFQRPIRPNRGITVFVPMFLVLRSSWMNIKKLLGIYWK